MGNQDTSQVRLQKISQTPTQRITRKKTQHQQRTPRTNRQNQHNPQKHAPNKHSSLADSRRTLKYRAMAKRSQRRLTLLANLQEREDKFVIQASMIDRYKYE